jgi:hypothetical protein
MGRWAVGALRLSLGATFGCSAVLKVIALYSGQLRDTVVWHAVGGTPAALAALVGVEMFIGIAFLSGIVMRAASAMAVVLLVAGSLAIAVEKVRAGEAGESPAPCGCFGALEGGASRLNVALLRNAVLAVAAVLALQFRSERRTAASGGERLGRARAKERSGPRL